MRAFMLISLAVIVPFTAIAALKAVTGDALSALVLGLMIFVTVAAWISGPSVATRRFAGRR